MRKIALIMLPLLLMLGCGTAIQEQIIPTTPEERAKVQAEDIGHVNDVKEYVGYFMGRACLM